MSSQLDYTKLTVKKRLRSHRIVTELKVLCMATFEVNPVGPPNVDLSEGLFEH